MNFVATKIVLRQIALWSVLVAVVSLLTLLFTVLGTITCAVLTGMMMAAGAHHRWQTIPVSLVFPGTVIVMAHASKVELTLQQRIWLPVLCLTAFWITYLLTRVLTTLEAKPSAPAVETITPAQVRNPNSTPPALSASSVRSLDLDDVQGTWRCENAGADGTIRKIEIASDQLSLKVIGPDDRTRQVATATMVLKRPGPAMPGAPPRT